MEEQMEEVCEKVCVFEESLEIDFDYEFDVEKYFEFSRPETIEEILESERWFHLSQGHPPSPLLLKLGLVTEELEGSDTTSPKYEHQYANSVTSDGGGSHVSPLDQWKKGPELLKPKPANHQSRLSMSSRLLQPTASQLAKQNQQIGVRGTRAPGRVQKLGSSHKSPGDVDATKRQKLEYGYLRKAAQLKHQTSFSHKVPRQVGSSNVNSSYTKPKSTVPKEPCLETANRAQRHRNKNASEVSCDSKYDSCSSTARPLHRKTLEPKKSTPSLTSYGACVSMKGSTKSVPCSMKENKNPNTAVVKSTRCCLKQNQIGRGRVTVIGC